MINNINYIVYTEIKQFINKTEQDNIDNTLNHKQPINLYNKTQYNCNYKIDEYILKKPYPKKKNVLPTDPTKKVRLIIYYNKFKTSKLIISNNTSRSTELLDNTNVVKENNAYVGLTSTTLSRRLTMHLNDSSFYSLTS